MRKAGYIVSLVAVILDSVVSGLLGVAMFAYGATVLALIIFALVAAEIVAIVNYKKSKGWVIFLLVLGALTIVTNLNANPPALSFTGIALLVGTILTLASKENNLGTEFKVVEEKTYTLEEVKALLDAQKKEEK